jgi:hypothetical protein
MFIFECFNPLNSNDVCFNLVNSNYAVGIVGQQNYITISSAHGLF